MHAKTLCQLLLLSLNRPSYIVAEELGISGPSLSRHAAGMLRKPNVLRKLAAYFNKEVPGEVTITSDHLLTPLTPQVLVISAHHLLKNILTKETKT